MLTLNGLSMSASPASASDNGTVVRLRPSKRRARQSPPRRKRNAEVRPREHLTPHEVERLMRAAGKRSRYGQRDALLILLAYRHGLRVSELAALRWDQVDLRAGLLHVRRLKNGTPSTHPLQGDELRALRQLKRDWPDSGGYVFASERGGPVSPAGVRKMIARTGEDAGFDYPVHPHQLRHACGYALANAGHDTRALQLWLGHRNIQHTVRYTELSAERFKRFWRD
jgi:type 1 fimbriae regulatory protein FimB/type 1 fimbriae regulatory protein FimE